MHPALKDIGLVLLDTILPERCVVCKNEHQTAICKDCLSHFAENEHTYCIVCGQVSPFGLTHNTCKAKNTPDRLLSVFSYTTAGCAESIITGKYKFIKQAFQILGSQMAKVLEDNLSALNKESTLITPLPLHIWRLRWRGFNQSEILAKQLASRLELAFEELLVRYKPTKTQKDLNRQQRQKNIAGSFKAKPNLDLTGKTVLLVDDVTTTGSTLLEASKSLKEVGAAHVWCIALAKE